MKTICIFAPHLTHAMETIGFYFRRNDSKVIFATQTGGDERSEHPWSLRRVESVYPIRSISDAPIQIDLLIADAFMDPRFAKDRSRWASQAAEVAFIFPYNGMTLRSRAAHIVRSWPHSLTALSSIFVGDRRASADLLPPFLQRRVFYPPYLHPQLLVDHSLEHVFSSFDVMERRRYPIGFIGNRNPPERFGVLEDCRRAIEQAYVEPLWIEYGDHDHVRGLASDKYIDALGELDFCICPAGWGGNWTHRVIEALCRGAIPILPDPHLYGLQLRDSVTCLVVKDDWHEAVSTALNLPTEKIQEMRGNILNLRETMLRPSAAARRFCCQF